MSTAADECPVCQAAEFLLGKLSHDEDDEIRKAIERELTEMHKENWHKQVKKVDYGSKL